MPTARNNVTWDSSLGVPDLGQLTRSRTLAKDEINMIEKPGKDPPSCACLYAVATNVDTDENEIKDKDEVEDEAEDEINMIKKPGKDPPSCACLYAVATNVDTDENEIQDMVTDVGTDRNQIADVVKTNANDRDCVGPHLTPETLLKQSGREETDGEPRRGRHPRDRG